ncbi:MAG: BTAD domain-containing putative transcriptional regulator [Ilumatobacter sp.]|uniref:BTAD domain-containing putative transcriptional regulator n=1 Tax=Ilumatobacter sp. TaxID=1967498 RepID=UPI0026077026|nr:BTAD domain-containing putative transcriptional regulator [Ilumatobacter sp.]MDJ0770602.1 BTAD domain-containing putative transcriptional regulator [Ilumatobacter sp.]
MSISEATGAVPRRAVVHRQRLIDQLRRRFEARLTLVVGGAGCGKTTLLAQAMESEAEQIDVWYPCEAADRVTDRLLAGLLAACQQALGGDPDAPERDPVEQIADMVLAVSPQQVCLILDDTQLLPTAEVITDLLAHLPGNGHVLASGRRRIDVPTARLDAGGELEQVTQSDLMMTADEVVQFANLRGVDADALDPAQGWPAFVELAARARGSDPRTYLEEEALRALDAARRRDLARFAFVGGGDDEVAAAVTGLTLLDLVGELPLVRWTGGWAQLHDLWGELLADELTEGERAAAAVAAARVARGRNALERAIDLCAEGGADDELLVTLEHAVAQGVVGGLRPQLLRRWQATIPRGDAEAPVGRLLAGLIERERDPTTAEATDALDAAAEGFRLAGNHELELVSLSHLGYVARISGEPDRVLAVQERIRRLSEHHPPAAPFVLLCDAWLALVRGRPRDQLAAVEAIDPTQLPLLWSATRDHLVAHALGNLGRPHEALAAVPRDIESGHLAIPGALSTELGCHWWAGHPEVIHDWPADGLGPEYGARDRFVTNSFLAFCRANAGDIASARRLLAAAEEGAGAAPGSLIAAQLVGVRMVIDVVESNEEAAATTLRAILEHLPLGEGISDQMLRSFLTFPYVLVPETRSFWETADLGPSLVEGRYLAAAFAGARERDDLGAIATMRWPEPGLIAARLPVNWAMELAVYGAHAGRYEAGRLAAWLCEHWGRPARDALARWIEHPALGAAARELRARTPTPPDQPVAVRLLGETRLTVNRSDTADPDWRRERVRALLVWLVLNPESSRNRAAAALWPDLDPDKAGKNLRTTLNYVHRVLEPQRTSRDAAWFVRADGQHLTLHRSLDVDLWRFNDLLERADDAERRGRPTEALPVLVEAAGLWRGDLAADLDHEWLDLERIHVGSRFVRAACRAAELLVATRRPAEAIDMARTALEADPYHERSYLALAGAYRAVGDHTSARAILDRAADQLGAPVG